MISSVLVVIQQKETEFLRIKKKMDRISSLLQYSISEKYENMQFVVELDPIHRGRSIRQIQEQKEERPELQPE